MSGAFVVSQLGARMHYAVPRIFHSAGRLERLYTDICATKGWPRMLAAMPKGMLPGPLRRLAGRVPVGIPTDRISCFPSVGLRAAASRMRDRSRANDTHVSLLAGERFSSGVVAAGFARASGFYGIAGECLEQIEAARERGLTTVVEQIIAPRRVMDALVAREAASHTGWEPPVEDDPFADAFAEREIAEWAAADLIVCPSPFVIEGVAAAGGPVEKCRLVPYGVDAAPLDLDRRGRTGPLRVLTVGALGLRKGTPYVEAAARRLSREVSFRALGPVNIFAAKAAAVAEAVDLRGVVPRAEVRSHLEWADVFLLPSVCEGSATAIYEALAAGLPVITTPNAGSVVRHGVDGFIVGLGDADSIAEHLLALATDRELRAWMSAQALERSRSYSVAEYGRRLLAAINRASEEAAAPEVRAA